MIAHKKTLGQEQVASHMLTVRPNPSFWGYPEGASQDDSVIELGTNEQVLEKRLNCTFLSQDSCDIIIFNFIYYQQPLSS